MVTTGFFCSGQSRQSTADSVYVRSLDSVYVGGHSTKTVQHQKPLPNHKGTKFNTRYEYMESNDEKRTNKERVIVVIDLLKIE